MTCLRTLPTAIAIACLWLGAAVCEVRAQQAQSSVDLTRLTGPGTTPGRKTLRSMRDLRYQDLMRQRYDFSCGSSALASLLHYGYGLDVSEPELIKKMMVGVDPREVVKNGFSMLDMKRYVESIGMRGHGFRVDADALYRLQMPVIALLDLRGYKHFVVVKGAANGRVFVADPALGHRVMLERDFVKGWNGIILAVVADRPMRTDSYLVSNRSSPALQRRVEALDRATTPPRVVEFGLVITDLF
ncbi:C39 family peptidase [Lysobacter silvisoli]|uniref:Peptidase C39 n=1 Tax=Lysobacter silvisoli TaxID=2293254 RepID=A0A371JY48_9GAMM|nr:C39 family peptidase [Lysobacter silvisoli]RDZ26585.1 peptidase C39 [Lysobacter silvisoli]